MWNYSVSTELRQVISKTFYIIRERERESERERERERERRGGEGETREREREREREEMRERERDSTKGSTLSKFKRFACQYRLCMR